MRDGLRCLLLNIPVLVQNAEIAECNRQKSTFCTDIDIDLSEFLFEPWQSNISDPTSINRIYLPFHQIIRKLLLYAGLPKLIQAFQINPTVLLPQYIRMIEASTPPITPLAFAPRR